MRTAVITFIAFLTVLACSKGNTHQKNDKLDNGFNAWQVISDTNFLVQWENTTLKSIDSITSILIKEEEFTQETINSIKVSIVDAKFTYGSRKWLLNKLNEYKHQLETTLCNSMYIISLKREGEVMTSTYWVILFLNNQCRFLLTMVVENGVIIRTSNKQINKYTLDKLIKENYPSALMISQCLDKGEGLPVAVIYISKFTKNSTEVYPFLTFCSGFYEKFISVMQK